MIKSFKHKGLESFFFTGSKKGIQPEYADKLSRILDRLDVAQTEMDMNLPGYRLHEFKGDEKGIWSVTVNGNWRVTYKFESGNAYIIDYRDYH